MANAADGRKQSVYIPRDMLVDILAECARRNALEEARGSGERHGISRLVREAWGIARGEIMNWPAPHREAGAYATSPGSGDESGNEYSQ